MYTKRPLSAGLFALTQVAAACAVAQPGDADYELVTTAIHTRASATALPVTVLAGDELHDEVRATLGDTLSWQPGISNASFGPAVGQPVIRGQSARRVLNMVNAVPTADASGNSSDHAVVVEAILADSIEVLRGPATLLYGGGAIGGVVNVIDNRIPVRPVTESTFTVEARHDSAASLDNIVGRLEFATGDFSWHLDGLAKNWEDLEIPGLAIDPAYLEEDDHEEEEDEHHEEEVENTDGFVANTGGETSAWTAGGAWHFENGFIGLSVNEFNNLYGLPAGAHMHHHEGHEDEDHEEEGHEEEHHEEENVLIDMDSTRYDLSAEFNFEDNFIEKINYRMALTEYTHSELEGPGVVGTSFSNDSIQHRLLISHQPMGSFHGVAGLQFSDEEFSAIGEESFIPVTDITSTGLFLVEDFHTGNTTWEFGARLGRDSYSPQNGASVSRDFNTSSLSISALSDFSDWFTTGLSISRSQRSPSIEELYANEGVIDPEACVIHLATSSCEIGNSNMSRETALNTDLTFSIDRGRTSATITLFNNDFSDYIFLNNSGEEVDEFAIRYFQQADARFSGIEADIDIDLSADWQLRVFADLINSHIEGAGDAPRLPPARLGTELSYSAGNWQASTSVLHAFEQNEPGNNELPTDSYTRWDAELSYTLSNMPRGEALFFLKARNIADEEIRAATSVLRGFAPEPGRSLEAGVRFRY